VTAPGGEVGEASAGASPRWRWRRPDPEDPFPLYAAAVPGVLGDDGVTVELTRAATLRSACPVCGRRARLWWATLRLPAPWGAAGAYRGCTIAHAVALIPRDWLTVAEGYALAGAAVAAEGRTSAWHRHQIALYRDRSTRAAWLHDHPAAWRTLALALWAGNHLDVDKTAAIVAAAMAEPPIAPPSPSAGPVDTAPAG
jgi:hypothetical protein